MTYPKRSAFRARAFTNASAAATTTGSNPIYPQFHAAFQQDNIDHLQREWMRSTGSSTPLPQRQMQAYLDSAMTYHQALFETPVCMGDDAELTKQRMNEFVVRQFHRRHVSERQRHELWLRSQHVATPTTSGHPKDVRNDGATLDVRRGNYWGVGVRTLRH